MKFKSNNCIEANNGNLKFYLALEIKLKLKSHCIVDNVHLLHQLLQLIHAILECLEFHLLILVGQRCGLVSGRSHETIQLTQQSQLLIRLSLQMELLTNTRVILLAEMDEAIPHLVSLMTSKKNILLRLAFVMTFHPR